MEAAETLSERCADLERALKRKDIEIAGLNKDCKNYVGKLAATDLENLFHWEIELSMTDHSSVFFCSESRVQAQETGPYFS